MLWLAATSAFAGRVVVLELPGDRHGRLRAQIEAAVRHTRVDPVVSLTTFRHAAAKEGLRGSRAMTPAAVKRVAGRLDLSIAVSGAMASAFYVRFLDRKGQELWSRKLRVRRGLVSRRDAARLAKAISAAVRQTEAAAASLGAASASAEGPAKPGRPKALTPPAGVRSSTASASNPSTPTAGPGTSTARAGSGALAATSTPGAPANASATHRSTTALAPEPSASSRAATADATTGASIPTALPPSTVSVASGSAPSRRSTATLAPGATAASHPSADDAAASPSASHAVATATRGQSSSTATDTAASPDGDEAPDQALPRLAWVKVLLLGSARYRSYCARPGVSRCGDYDAQALGDRSPGPTVDFSAQVPYGGFDLGLELFPLAQLSSPVRGLGLVGAYHRGFALIRVHPQAGTGETPDTEADASDTGYRLEAAFRWLFARGDSGGLTGFVGARAGFVSRTFDVDSSVAAILPGAHHRGPTAAIDFSFPFARWLRAELSAELYPHLLPGADETVGFGSSGAGFGYGFQVGPAGQLWGPLGYSARVVYLHLTDTFEGQGVSWQGGGVTEEGDLSLQLGLTVEL